MLVRIWVRLLRVMRRDRSVRVVRETEVAPKREETIWREMDFDPPQAQDPAPMKMREVGNSNLQVGHAGGSVSHRVSHHTHTHSHITIIQAPTPAPARPTSSGMFPEVAPAAVGPTSFEQSAVLRRLDQLRNKVPVLEFMEREFGTKMVIHLKSEQMFRLNRYLDVVMSDGRKVQGPPPGGRPGKRAGQSKKFA